MHSKYTISHLIFAILLASAVLLPVVHKLVHHHEEFLVECVSNKKEPHLKELHEACEICLFSPASFDFSNSIKSNTPALRYATCILSYYKSPYAFINKRYSKLRAPPYYA